MNKSVTNFCILFLAFIAVGWAQVAGLNHHYVCVCTGEPIEVSADHCHAHGAQIVTDEEEPHDDHADHHDSQPHTPLKQEFKAQNKTSAAVSVQAPAPIMLFDLPDFAWPVLPLLVADIQSDSRPPDHVVASPPTSLQVTECVVLLV